jgi:hypothetical protein
VSLTASPTLLAAMAEMPLCRLVFAHRFLEDAPLEPLKGSLWHGVFGACLHDLQPAAYAALFDLEESRRPWALVPPLDAEPWVPAGAVVQAAITLIGPEAVPHAAACVQALAEMGRRGLGSRRAKAELLEVALQSAEGDLLPWPEAYSGLAAAIPPIGTPSAAQVWLAAQAQARSQLSAQAQGLSLRLLTPLRLKQGGEIQRDAPELALLQRRLLGRWVLLNPQREGGLFAPGERDAWLGLAEQAPLLEHHLQGLSWQRRSARQQRHMPLEGLCGRLRYGPPAQALRPWWALAEWLQLGSKTSFGLGVVQMAA